MKFSDLTRKQRSAVVRKLRMSFSAAGYDIVHGPDQMLRKMGSIELSGEDGALPAFNRLKMINMARQGMRNGDSLRALMKQMELNVVGTVGGKATFAFPEGYRDAAGRMREAFADWAREAEFSDSLPLSKVLSLVVDTKFIGGDMVLLFDDNLIEDSGKILAFEPDEIADVPRDWLHEKFSSSWTQRQGRIYNQNGRFMGVTVSHKYRGAQMFRRDENGVLFLTVDPSQTVQDWVMLREVWRFNQGRGVSPLAAPLDSLMDLESVTKFEVQAAMKNCQTLGQIYSTVQQGGKGDEEPDELDPELARRAASLGGEDDADSSVSDAAGDDGDDLENIELDNIKGSGAIFDLLPDNYKMELLDTKRPNPNVEGFVKWLSGRSGAAVGLAKCYATMEASQSYTAFRGEQVMSWPVFEEWQKALEREVCDWVVRKWAFWAVRKGIIDGSSLPAGWARCVSWAWPVMREVDMKATAEARKVMLENGLVTLAELHPGDPDGYMAELGKDVERYHRIGLVHPMERSVSGGLLEVKKGKEDGKTEDE